MAEFNNLLDQQRILQRQDLTSTEKFVAIVILSFRNAETGRCNPPIVSKNKEKETVCTRTGFSDVCVQKAICSLESKKVFQVTRELGMPSFFIFGGTNEVSTGTNVVTPNEVSRGANHVKGGTNEVSTGVLTRLVHNKEITNKEQISNNEKENTKEKNPGEEFDLVETRPLKTKPKSKRATPLPKPEDITEQTWRDFETLRKAKRAPITATAIKRIQDEADKAGISLEIALQVCCERGWQSFKADWYLKSDSYQQKNGYTKRKIAEPENWDKDYGESRLM